ncbi:MAG: hypothetical protein ACE14V_00760 [bacterium]
MLIISEFINAILMLISFASFALALAGFVFVVGYILITIFKIVIKIIRSDSKQIEIIKPIPAKLPTYRKIMNLSYFAIPISWILAWGFYLLSFWYQGGNASYCWMFFLSIQFFLAEMSVFWCIWQWRNFKWIPLIPVVMSILFVWLGRPPDSIRDKIIASRLEYNLPQYDQLITTIKQKNLSIDEYQPESFPAIRVYSHKTDSGNWQIQFFTGGMGIGSTLHWYYIYSENEVPSAGYYGTIHLIKPNWYWYRD